VKKKNGKAPAWPVDDDGRKIKGAKLIFANNPVELGVTQSLLGAYGIPSLASVPNQGFFSTVVFGSALLGADVYVPETQLEEARALIEADNEGLEGNDNPNDNLNDNPDDDNP